MTIAFAELHCDFHSQPSIFYCEIV